MLAREAKIEVELKQYARILESFNYPQREGAVAKHCMKCNGRLADRFDLGVCHNCRNGQEVRPYTMIMTYQAVDKVEFQLAFYPWVPKSYRDAMLKTFHETMKAKCLDKDLLTKAHVNLLRDYDDSVCSKIEKLRSKIGNQTVTHHDFDEIQYQLRRVAEKIPVPHIAKELVG